jgi:hypothetical protein
VALIVIGLLVIAGTAVAAKLAIGAISIETVPELTSPRSSTPSAAPSPDASLGDRVTIEQAAAESGIDVAVPLLEGVGSPDRVYLGRFGQVTAVSLRWAPTTDAVPWPELRKGFLLMEFAGDDPGAAVKQVVPETPSQPVRVSGGTGYWIDGPHQLVLADGGITRATGTVLLWERDGITYRLESKLTREHAVALAESVS